MTPSVRRPAWLVPTTLGLSVLGLLVSVYLTVQHFTGNATLVCSTTGAFNCERVTTSAWSSALGIPVAVLGLVFFVVTLGLCLPSVWRRSDAMLDRARIAWLSVGMVFVLYLIWAEFFRIRSLCSWCTAVHVITFLLWIAVLFGQILTERDEPVAPVTRRRVSPS